jgi:hypothetical protein
MKNNENVLMKSYHYGDASREKKRSNYKAENVWQHRQKPQKAFKKVTADQ